MRHVNHFNSQWFTGVCNLAGRTSFKRLVLCIFDDFNFQCFEISNKLGKGHQARVGCQSFWIVSSLNVFLLKDLGPNG